MWEYSGLEDRLRLSDSPLAEADLAEVLKTLLGKGDPFPNFSSSFARLRWGRRALASLGSRSLLC